MKSHKYWSIGALITMLGTFYTGYKGSKEGHKYFAASSLLCMIFAKFYFSSYFLNLAFLLKLRLFPFFQSAFKLFPKIFRPNFLSRRLSLQYSNHIIVLKRLIIVPIF